MTVGRKAVTPVAAIASPTAQMERRVVRGVVARRAVDLEVDQARGQQQSVELDAPCRTRGGVLAKVDDAPSCQAHAGRRTDADARFDHPDPAQDDGLGHNP